MEPLFKHLVIVAKLAATAHALKIGGDFANRFPFAWSVGHAFQIYIAPTRSPIHFAGETEGLVDRGADGIVATHAKEVFLIGIGP